MSDLGDLLVLLHEAPLRCRTVRATGRTWHHGDRARAAADRSLGVRGAGSAAAGGAGGVAERVSAWRLVFERPDHARLERDRPGGDFASPSVIVDDGVVRTMLRPDGRPNVLADRRTLPASEPPPPPLFGPLLDPSPLLGGFRFTVTGRAEAAGRPAVAASAVPTGAIPGHQLGLPRGVDELELLVDAEYGVLLRLVCNAQGAAVEVQQVREIAFDEPVPAGAFDAGPPEAARAPVATPAARPAPPAPEPELAPEPAAAPDATAAPAPAPVPEAAPALEPRPEPVTPEPVTPEPVLPAPAVEPEPMAQRPVPTPTVVPEPEPVAQPTAEAGAAVGQGGLQPVSLEEAVRGAGFPVLLPRKVPGGPKLRILLNASADDPNVQLHYEFEAPSHHLRLDERPAASAAPTSLPFERRTHRGHELDVWEGPGGARATRIERGGIAVQLDTDLDLETLLDVTVSLVPVRVTRSPGAGGPPGPMPAG